jgi:hypothetical protein
MFSGEFNFMYSQVVLALAATWFSCDTQLAPGAANCEL